MNAPGEARENRVPPDVDGGPLVRPYTMTNGRVRPSVDGFDLLAYVLTLDGVEPDPALHPEHWAVLGACYHPLSVAELAAQIDLPLGVVRVLLGDLLERGLITVREPADQMRLPDVDILEAVMNGLRAL